MAGGRVAASPPMLCLLLVPEGGRSSASRMMAILSITLGTMAHGGGRPYRTCAPVEFQGVGDIIFVGRSEPAKAGEGEGSLQLRGPSWREPPGRRGVPVALPQGPDDMSGLCVRGAMA